MYDRIHVYLFCSVNGLVVVTNYDPPHVADAYLQETIGVNLIH
jgi:hypothetical protein